MAHSDGFDLAPADAQLDMFGATAPHSYPEVSVVRAEIAGVLGKVRAAPSEPWAASDVAHLRNIFARMARHLPADEAAQLSGQLEAELTRLAA